MMVGTMVPTYLDFCRLCPERTDSDASCKNAIKTRLFDFNLLTMTSYGSYFVHMLGE